MFNAFKLIHPADNPPPSFRPLFLKRVPCGFPSPCQDYAEQELNLNEYLIAHRASTFFLRAQGNSMQDAGLYDGDLLIVDRSLTPEHNDVVGSACTSALPAIFPHRIRRCSVAASIPELLTIRSG